MSMAFGGESTKSNGDVQREIESRTQARLAGGELAGSVHTKWGRIDIVKRPSGYLPVIVQFKPHKEFPGKESPSFQEALSYAHDVAYRSPNTLRMCRQGTKLSNGKGFDTEGIRELGPGQDPSKTSNNYQDKHDDLAEKATLSAADIPKGQRYPAATRKLSPADIQKLDNLYAKLNRMGRDDPEWDETESEIEKILYGQKRLAEWYPQKIPTFVFKGWVFRITPSEKVGSYILTVTPPNGQSGPSPDEGPIDRLKLRVSSMCQWIEKSGGKKMNAGNPADQEELDRIDREETRRQAGIKPPEDQFPGASVQFPGGSVRKMNLDRMVEKRLADDGDPRVKFEKRDNVYWVVFKDAHSDQIFRKSIDVKQIAKIAGAVGITMTWFFTVGWIGGKLARGIYRLLKLMFF